MKYKQTPELLFNEPESKGESRSRQELIALIEERKSYGRVLHKKKQ